MAIPQLDSRDPSTVAVDTDDSGEKIGGMENLRPLPEVIAALWRNRSSGRLTVRSGSTERDFTFVDGELRSATSSVDEEKLGSWLVDKGLASEDDVALGLLTQVGEAVSPLGHILVQHKLVEKTMLEESLRELAVTILERATEETRDAIEFEEGATVGRQDTLIGTSTEYMILFSARAVTDPTVKAGTARKLNRSMRLCGRLEAIMSNRGLTARELSLLQRLEDSPTVRALRSISGLGPEDFDEAVYPLLVSGYVEIFETPAPELPRDEPAPPLSEPARDISLEAAGLEGVPESDQDDVRLELARHEQLLRFGDVTNAFQRLERVCEMAPTPSHLLRLARFMREHKMATKRILETLRLALEIDPGMVECWVELARYWQFSESVERQRKAVVHALQIDPGNVDAREMADAIGGVEI